MYAFTRADTRAQTRLRRAGLSKLARSPPDNDGGKASHFRSNVAYPRVSRDPAGCGKARCAVAAVPGETRHNAPRTTSRCYGDERAEESRAIRSRARDRARWRCIIKSRSRNGLNVAACPLVLGVLPALLQALTMSDIPTYLSTYCTPIFAGEER